MIEGSAAERVIFIMLSDSSVERVVEIAFSISRRIVRLGVASGTRIVDVVVWRRCRVVVMVERDGRWVRSGGVLRLSWEAACSEALWAD